MTADKKPGDKIDIHLGGVVMTCVVIEVKPLLVKPERVEVRRAESHPCGDEGLRWSNWP